MKVLYVIFFMHKGLIIQILVPKGCTVTGKFYKNIILRKLKNYKNHCPKTGLKYLLLLNDNAVSERVTLHPHPLFLPDLAPFFLFPRLKYLSGKRYKSRNVLGSAVYQYLIGVPIEEYEQCFQKWIDQLKRCIQANGEYFEGQSKLKWSEHLQYRRTDASYITFGTPPHISLDTVMIAAFQTSVLLQSVVAWKPVKLHCCFTIKLQLNCKMAMQFSKISDSGWIKILL